MHPRPLIIYEVNELPFRVVDYFRDRHPNSAFDRLCRCGTQFQAATTDSGHLHPKVSWPTFHRGVNDDTHGICEFNQNLTEINQQYPPIWKIVRDHGYRIGIGGSIAWSPVPKNLENVAYFMPDMFAPTAECYPAYLAPFQELNISMVKANSRVVRKLPKLASLAKLAVSAPRLGISSRTLWSTFRQLATERFLPHRIVRRRTLQSTIAFDLILNQIRKTKPDLATYFTNHVASSMHRYWAATFPQDYDGYGFDEKWREQYQDEIEFVMAEADYQLKSLMAFADDDPRYLIMVIGSMGQAATQVPPVKNQILLRNPTQLFATLGLNEYAWKQLAGMEPVYNFQIDPCIAAKFVTAIESIRIAGHRLIVSQLDATSFAVRLGIENINRDDPRASVFGKPVSLEGLGMIAEEIQDGTGATAHHVPEGVLLVYDPQQSQDLEERRPTVTTPQVAAAVLEHFRVPVPSYMPEPDEALRRCFTRDHRPNKSVRAA